MEPKNNNQNESANVQDAQVSNPVTTEADVAEVDDIKPVVTRRAVAEAMVQAANGGPATTMPLGKHGTLVIAGVGGDESRRKSGNNGKAAPTTTEEPKKSDVRGKKEDVPQPSDIIACHTQTFRSENHQTSTLPVLTFAIYKTDDGNEIPQIVGFGGEDDPRWKKRYDERMRLNAAAAEAKKKNEKLREQIKAACKGKTKEEKAAIKKRMMKKWVHTTSDPFGARLFTDRLTGEKKYYFSMGTKYADVARELCDAYNSGDAQAIAQAEQAVIDRRASINADYEAQREERKAAKMEDGRRKMEEPATAQAGYSDQDVADMLRKVMAGGDVPENIKKLLQAA